MVVKIVFYTYIHKLYLASSTCNSGYTDCVESKDENGRKKNIMKFPAKIEKGEG